MEIGSVISTGQSIANQNPVTARPATADVTTLNKSSYERAPVKVQAVDKVDIASIDQKRSEAIQQAIRHAFSDVYAVSDTSFTIYKDSKGEYVTRVRSLRDGSVAYYPEPEMLNKLHSVGIDLNGLVQVNI
jgi:hypothetical protein